MLPFTIRLIRKPLPVLRPVESPEEVAERQQRLVEQQETLREQMGEKHLCHPKQQYPTVLR